MGSECLFLRIGRILNQLEPFTPCVHGILTQGTQTVCVMELNAVLYEQIADALSSCVHHAFDKSVRRPSLDQCLGRHHSILS